MIGPQRAMPKSLAAVRAEVEQLRQRMNETIGSFDDLKPGDPIFIRGNRGALRLTEVARRTPTLIILENGVRYRAKNGWELGGSVWCRSSLRIPTAELFDALDEQQREEKRSRLLSGIRFMTRGQMDAVSLEDAHAAARHLGLLAKEEA